MGGPGRERAAGVTTPFNAAEAERFRTLVARRLGLQFEDAKLGFLADVLRRRVESTRGPVDAYLSRLEAVAARDEIRALAQELTVAETYFFRNIEQFHAFASVALPDRLRAQSSRRRLRILSAGCASGEEAYSIAMLVRDAPADQSWDISIRGVDINPAGLRKAVGARYSTWALREAPPDIQQRWFRRIGREVALQTAALGCVTFEERNLADDDAELWMPGAYDVVFCRNVIMYFTPESAEALIARIGRSLAPGGYLFLGHAETLRGLSLDFHLHHTHGTFYYQRKEGVECSAAPYVADAAPPAVATFVEAGDSWVDVIRGAAERVRALTPSAAAPALATMPPSSGWDLTLALDLVRQERFGEALEVVRALPPDASFDPDVLLLHAVLLAHKGQLLRAEEACQLLLGIDELNAGAHYVLALCREGAGDRRGAAHHDQVAVYLDATFAMPRLHLGLLARHAGNRDAARQEFRQALALLRREDASRLLLFGGGFTRDTLTALCRAGIEACGAA